LWGAGIRVDHPNQTNIPLKCRKVVKADQKAERALKLYRKKNEVKTSDYLQGKLSSQKSGAPFAKMDDGSKRFLERIFRELCDKNHDYSLDFSPSPTTQERVERQVLKYYKDLKAKAGASDDKKLGNILGNLADADIDVDTLMKLALDKVALASPEQAS
jgi:hypothetical protein